MEELTAKEKKLCEKWIKKQRLEGKDWELILFACEENETDLVNFLEERKNDDNWPDNLNVDMWKKLVKEVKDEEDEKGKWPLLIFMEYNVAKKIWGMNKRVFSLIILPIPLVMALSEYLYDNWNRIMNYEPDRLISLISAAVWTFIGPALIIRWKDRYYSFISTIDELPHSKRNKCTIRNKYFDDNKDRSEWSMGVKCPFRDKCFENSICQNEKVFPKGIARASYENEMKRNGWKMFLFQLLWVGLVVFVLLLPVGRENLKSYYFKDISDPYYKIFVLCVAYIAYFTSYFFLFLRISWKTINDIINGTEITGKRKRNKKNKRESYESRLNKRSVMVDLLLNTGKSNDLSLIGDLISHTVKYFCSGLLFLPILVKFTQEIILVRFPAKEIALIVLCLLIIIYLVLIFKYMISLINRVSSKAQEEKNKTIEKIKEVIVDKESGTFREYTLDERIRFASKMNTNPIASDQFIHLLQGILLSAILPVLFGFLLK